MDSIYFSGSNVNWLFEYINDEDLDAQEYHSLMNTWSTNIFDDTMAFQQNMVFGERINLVFSLKRK